MAAALVDAGPMASAFGLNQPHTQHYLALFKTAAQAQWSLSTTWPCVVEASYLLSPPQRYTFLRWIGAGALAVFPFQQENLDEFVRLMARYTESPKSEMDLADASLVWLAADTGVSTIMTLDVHDFRDTDSLMAEGLRFSRHDGGCIATDLRPLTLSPLPANGSVVS